MDYKLMYDDFHRNNYNRIEEDGAYYHLIEQIKKVNLNYNTVCDVGCSIGNGLKKFIEEGKNPVGVDVSEVAVDVVKSRGYEAYCSSVVNIPLANDSFDLVASTDMLEHLVESDIIPGISEMIRISKRYLAFKIATIPETSDVWAKKARSLGIDIPNLHISIFDNNRWKSYFNQFPLKLLDEYNHRAGFVLLIYEKII